MTDFRWNAWNLEHATKHGVAVHEVEHVVRNARRPYPRDIGDEKWLVEGRGQGDRFVRVIYVLDMDGTIYVLHAMPLTTRRRRSH
jgi:phage-related protein